MRQVGTIDGAGPGVGEAVGEAGAIVVGADVVTGLIAGIAKTEFGRLTDMITGAAHAALTSPRLVMPSSLCSAASAASSSSCTRLRNASSSASASDDTLSES